MDDHVRHHNDMLAHVEQSGAELVRKAVRSILGDLASYMEFRGMFLWCIQICTFVNEIFEDVVAVWILAKLYDDTDGITRQNLLKNLCQASFQ